MDTRTTMIMIVVGAIFWFIAAMVVRLFPALFGGDLVTIVLFVASVPIAWIYVKIVMKIMGLTAKNILPAAIVSVITGTLLDGIFMTWLPTLYGTDSAVNFVGAAWILWGVGLISMAAYQKADTA